MFVSYHSEFDPRKVEILALSSFETIKIAVSRALSSKRQGTPDIDKSLSIRLFTFRGIELLEADDVLCLPT